MKINYDLIQWLIIMFLLCLCVVLYVYGSECEKNSFTWGAQTVKDSTGVDIECSCYAKNTIKQFQPMHFNATTVWFGEKFDFLE